MNKELAKKFGPRLIEAIIELLCEEINEVRKKNGLSPYTDTTIKQKVMLKHSEIKLKEKK